ncbi:hypothetical protein EIN_186010 [Entamoeba invadens IP1]|uniref:hypothetical protein n=1 Tax=Entamoeba invadens IP1 TaxID=370355 RepID=UPI0002C3F9E7|nr:hypothetical protein EIN_186010 [Entamoeba invadens IP1]ELP94184.1 hypothetical protein EIN_186010 [Entamoeba invadens IP1]|eukprot:XP_004260955.1 hypothetical protein EIN_186010 [Entamoeba invadens IP1]
MDIIDLNDSEEQKLESQPQPEDNLEKPKNDEKGDNLKTDGQTIEKIVNNDKVVESTEISVIKEEKKDEKIDPLAVADEPQGESTFFTPSNFFVSDLEAEKEKKQKYDDVLSESANNTTYVAPEFIETTVDNPEVIQDANGKFIIYTVTTRSSYTEYKPGEFTVKRRYNQFQSLKDQLKEFRDNTPQSKVWGAFPKFPGDTFMSAYFPGYRFKPEFTKQRALELNQFLQALLQHPSYTFHDLMIKFLTQPDFEIVKLKTKIVFGNESESSSEDV